MWSVYFFPQSKDECIHECICLVHPASQGPLEPLSDLERDNLRKWFENTSLCFTKLDLSLSLKRAVPQAKVLITCISDQVTKWASQQHSVITNHLLVFSLENKMPSYSCMVTSSTVENAENVRRFRDVGKYREYKLENWVLGAKNLNTWQSNCWVTEIYQRRYHTPGRYIIVIQKYAAVCILTALVTPRTLTFTQDTHSVFMSYCVRSC